MGLIFDVFGV